jgi:hypothetical protein
MAAGTRTSRRQDGSPNEPRTVTPGRAAVAAAIITAAGGIVVALIQVVGPAIFGPAASTAPGPGASFGPGPGESALFLSKESGPGGSTLNVSGEGFAPGETIEIRFHTESVATTRADAGGGFANVQITVPPSFSVFAPQQFSLIATGRTSLRSAMAPFTISG